MKSSGVTPNRYEFVEVQCDSGTILDDEVLEVSATIGANPMLNGRSSRTIIFVLGAAFGLSTLSFGQDQLQGKFTPYQTPLNDKFTFGSKTINFKSNLGSCKFLPKSDFGFGQIEMNFTGTVLINGFEGKKCEVTGNVRKEFDGYGRKVYFGTGKLVLDGKFRAVQWFGSNMAGKWTGDGLVRWYGEFDQKLETGKFWFSDPAKYTDWGTTGFTTELPEKILAGDATKVVPKKRGG